MAEQKTGVRGERRERPISPHLSIYRPQITWIPSITHRVTGVGLGLGLLLLTWWLVALALGPEAYGEVRGFLDHWLGRLLLFGFTWALMFHFLNGIRHLGWDVGIGLEIGEAAITGWIVVIGSVVLTLFVWVLGYMALGEL